MTQSGTIITSDSYEDIKEELVQKGCYHLREGQAFICPKCQSVVEGAGHPDPCLGKLPGVRFACCGHGKDYGYIVFENGTVVISKTGFDVEYWRTDE
ncbi:MAG: hypothetical protein PVI03_03215 [Candidatus Thorarchaeota archaeon]